MPVDLNSMTKAELTEYAESLGINVGSNWTKAQIMDAINA